MKTIKQPSKKKKTLIKTLIKTKKTASLLLGIIIQVVKKSSTVQDASGTIYATSDAISQFTSGNVNFSNESYFEYWKIDKTGRSINDDIFGNNSLTQYDKAGPLTYDPTSSPAHYETYKTEGTIVMNSTSCYIHHTNPEYHHILNGLQWEKGYTPSTRPANGLPYLQYDPALEQKIFNASDSNQLIHNITIKWSFDNPKSVINATSRPRPRSKTLAPPPQKIASSSQTSSPPRKKNKP